MSNFAVSQECADTFRVMAIAFCELTTAGKDLNESVKETKENIDGLKVKPKFKKEHPFKKFIS